jgi:hypothetical protein
MTVFCISQFKDVFDKLSTKKAYSDLEADIIDYFFNTTIEAIKTGDLLNNSADAPYIKKRLSGRGGYRIYYLIIVKDDNVYLMYVVPKTGTYGAQNLKADYIKELYKTVIQCIKNKDLYEVTLCDKGVSLVFTAAL